MSIYSDPILVQTEIDRRFELAGIDVHDTHDHDRHRHDLPPRPLGAHPLAAFVARLVGGRAARTPGGTRPGTVAAGRPRHP